MKKIKLETREELQQFLDVLTLQVASKFSSVAKQEDSVYRNYTRCFSNCLMPTFYKQAVLFKDEILADLSPQEYSFVDIREPFKLSIWGSTKDEFVALRAATLTFRAQSYSATKPNLIHTPRLVVDVIQSKDVDELFKEEK